MYHQRTSIAARSSSYLLEHHLSFGLSILNLLECVARVTRWDVEDVSGRCALDEIDLTALVGLDGACAGRNVERGREVEAENCGTGIITIRTLLFSKKKRKSPSEMQSNGRRRPE